MSQHSNRQARVRAYAAEHGVSYTQALRALYPHGSTPAAPAGDTAADESAAAEQESAERQLMRALGLLRETDEADAPELEDDYPVKPVEERRFCMWVDETCYTPQGYVPAVVTEDEAGFSPMIGRGSFSQPWYFGRDIATARRLVEDYNTKLGLSEQDVDDIVVSSMRAQGRADAAHDRWQRLRQG